MMTIRKNSGTLVLADSGGSKTDWILIKDGLKNYRLQTMGLNPSLVGPELIMETLRTKVAPWLGENKLCDVLFFGAGLTRKNPKSRMKKLLMTHLDVHGKVTVQPDILGAGYACLGNKKGVVGILGTGSIAFRFNGKKITGQKGGLGFLVGDVGGGVALGRVFFRRLVNRDFPKHILDAYPRYSGIKINQVLETLYSHVSPAKFLAAQVPFMALKRSEPEIRQIISDQFNGFLDVYLGSLIKRQNEQIVFMGGVARTFKEILLYNCSQRSLANVSVFMEAPINALAEYFQRLRHQQAISEE